MSEQSNIVSSYESKIHKYGTISSYIIVLFFILVPLSIQLAFNIELNVGGTLAAFLAAFSAFGPAALVEFISYAPILGAGGQYLAFTTGNIMNMKMPAATSALKICEIEPGSPEVDPIATIAIGVSSIVTTIILFLGLLLSAQMLPFLQSPQMGPAFDNVMPAILGAVAAPILTKDLKVSSVPCILVAALTMIIGYPAIAANQTYLLPVFLIISVAWAYILYKRKNEKTEVTD